MMIQVDQAKIATLCKLIEAILIDPKTPQLSQDPAKANQILAGIFAFAYTWSIAGMLTEDGWESWDTFIREQMEDNNDCRLPQGICEIIFDYNYQIQLICNFYYSW